MSDEQDKLDEERLGKLVNLAKRGVGGEKETAERLVRRLCQHHGLDFDEVMSGDKKLIEARIVHLKGEQELALFVIYRYGFTELETDVFENKDLHVLTFKTTPEKAIETANAYSVLSRLYRTEKKKSAEAFELAFRIKHHLYYDPTEAEARKLRRRKEEKLTKAEEAKQEEIRRRALSMTYHMDDAQILKALPAGGAKKGA